MNRLFLIISLLAVTNIAFSQTSSSSKGTEFWTAYMEHVNGVVGNNAAQMALYITSDVNTTGTVDIADGSFATTFTVQANTVTTIAIPASAFLGGQGVFLKGIHIVAEKPIAVYAHIFANSVSGATLLLPVNTMGKEYYSINYTQRSNTPEELPAFSIFTIIATEDNTTVEITPTQSLVDGKQKDVPFTVNLKKGEVYQARAFEDLTGTRIQSISVNNQECKKIAVFSGSSKIGIGCNENNDEFSSDNVFQQVYPTAVWGKNYITVPLANRKYDVFRIVLSDRNTNVTLNGILQPLPAINEPNYIQFNSVTPNVINADKPIQVVQYAVTEGQGLNCLLNPNDTGDPEMIFLNPVEQTINKVTLYSTNNFQILKHYINVVIKSADVPSFRLDNATYTDFQPVAGTNNEYSYAKISVNSGTHNITASGGFNAIAYGFGSHESYGYSAGTNLQNLNEYIELHDPVANVGSTSGCTGVNYKLRLIIPYQPTKINWEFTDGRPAYTDNSPVSGPVIIRDNVTLYVYEYPQQVTYPPGDYSVIATAFSVSADVCGSEKEYRFDFNVTDPPVASFTNTAACLGDANTFTDTSDPKLSTIVSWSWDFGDGEFSDLQNPTHIYQLPGTYTAKLTIANVNGCTSQFTATVEIATPPVVDFTFPVLKCAVNDVVFTATSVQQSNLKEWVWDFGDGTQATELTPTASHSFASPGIYTVKMYAKTLSDCLTAEVTHTITVLPSPVVDFTMPDVCVNDPFAQFTDNSTISNNTESSFTYEWNFGDANATVANPNTSTQKDARHKYTAFGDYTVTLTVRSNGGCETTVSKSFTVNGAQIAAGVSVLNEDKLCSGSPVAFRNDAVLNFGSVTKIEWYFDLDANPNEKVVISRNDFPADGNFYHTYDAFNAPLTKVYRVKMVAYSGETCFDESDVKEITVNALPLIGLSTSTDIDISPIVNIDICSNDSPLQLNQAFNSFAGTGTFSGPGISGNGLFDPQQANIGLNDISYTFTSSAGCDYTTTFKINVIKAPVVDVKPQYTIFDGESILIDAQAEGENLTYAWEPALGLNDAHVLQPTASPLEDTDYNLTVSSAGICKYVAHVFVKVLNRLVVPNAFTPNDDGYNDTWNIKNIHDYPDCVITIFNRYGNAIYTSRGYGVPWNGTQNGIKLPVAAYYYIIDLKDGRKPVAGNVTILK